MKGTRFHDLVGRLRATLAGLPDRRKGKNRSYAMADFGLSVSGEMKVRESWRFEIGSSSGGFSSDISL